MIHQDALFGEPAVIDDRQDTPRVVTQDPEWVAVVVRHAQDPGYRVVEKSGRVFRVDPGHTGDVTPVPTHEADTVQQLVEAVCSNSAGTTRPPTATTADRPARYWSRNGRGRWWPGGARCGRYRSPAAGPTAGPVSAR